MKEATSGDSFTVCSLASTDSPTVPSAGDKHEVHDRVNPLIECFLSYTRGRCFSCTTVITGRLLIKAFIVTINLKMNGWMDKLFSGLFLQISINVPPSLFWQINVKLSCNYLIIE